MAIILDGTTGITTPDLIDSSLTSGRVVYAGASGNLTGSAGLFFDGTNLGIGATPNPAPGAPYNVLNIGAQGGGGIISAGTDVYLTNNLYISGNNYFAWTGGSAYASYYNQTGGNHMWQTSTAAGTGGNVATLNTLLKLNTNGALALFGGASANGVGITFPASQSASSDANTLDDYEEGTWTPTVTFGGNSVGITYNTTYTGATYTKIGNRVCISGFLLLTNKGSSTGGAVITNLPFTAESGNTRYLGVTIGGSAFTFANQFWATLSPGTTTILLQESLENGVQSLITNADFTNGTELYFSATYTV